LGRPQVNLCDMVALPAAHVERPHAVGAHVAERHGFDRFVEMRHLASLSRGSGSRRAHLYPSVEPTSHDPRPKFDGSEQGACRCLDTRFRSPAADFLVWTDWNGPQLSWALCLSDWRLGWSSHVCERYEACSQQWVCLPRTNRWLCSGYWAEEVASVVEASSVRSIEGAVSMVSLRFR
jgi:hypothetical protein